MSKKMKGVALDPSPYGSYEDSKARFKHQTLIQDYQELQKEAEAMRNKLETTKQRKLTLLAEVRFLRRRYKYLLNNKAAKPPQGGELVQPQKIETQPKNTLKKKTHHRKEANPQGLATAFYINQKERVFSAKESAHRNPSPVLDLNQKGRIRSGKQSSYRNTTAVFYLNQKERSCGGKETSFQNLTPILDLNQTERLHSGKETAPRNFDLNQMERTYVGREDTVQNRAPIFDLNQISGEEELLDGYQPEEPKKFMIRGGTDEQSNDLKLSVCRNIGNGPSRVGKRKISWQDQVALKV